MKNQMLFAVLLVATSWLNGPSMSQRHVVISSEKRASADTFQKTRQNVRIVFWNVENLYDPYDDTTKLDDEFTPAGAKHWSYSKFRIKLNHLSKTLLAIGEWEPPVVIGLCEVENRYVLNKLIYDSPLSGHKYRILHHDSPDRRGIDVAMLYRPDRFRLISGKAERIRFPFDTAAETREILLAKGIIGGDDTVFICINHWPSRRGGAIESQPRRNYVAVLLRKIVDSLFLLNPRSNIIIMGDFNDGPQDQSLCTHLRAATDTNQLSVSGLINLMAPKAGKEGTHKFRDEWGILDQFIVSAALFRRESGLETSFADAHIYRSKFLLSEDQRYFGKKPVRTYNGPKYQGGFSDHLPIFLDIRD
jgi:predicted extracellular nuclease